MTFCPCGTGQPYATCCEKYINGSQKPTTPEQLMRSRYTAYTKANIDYIQQTMKGAAAVGYDPLEAKKWAEQVKWLRLQVLKTGFENDETGWVEFRAQYIQQGKKCVLHEISRFECEEGQWYYVSGVAS